MRKFGIVRWLKKLERWETAPKAELTEEEIETLHLMAFFYGYRKGDWEIISNDKSKILDKLKKVLGK